MEFTTPVVTNEKTKVNVPKRIIQTMPCGLHRATLEQAIEYIPELESLYSSLPKEVMDDLTIDSESWVIDIKIHMLMKGMYPCIPNWHCDNVPRNDEGELQYGFVTPDSKPMYLWISAGPATLFLKNGFTSSVQDHGELNTTIREAKFEHEEMPEQTWIKMDQLTPHRGQSAKEQTWRIFCRLTHKSLIDDFMARQKVSPLRRHSQVYLPYNFNW